MLSATLAHKPTTWEDTSYTGVRFKTFQLLQHSNEYQKVSRYFGHQSISKILRVQHPYAYGRYLLQKDKIFLENGGSVPETTVFHGISHDDLNVALEYNCDSRRYSGGYKSTMPSFKSSAPYCDDTVIVLQKLQEQSQPTDANYYPTYVVELA